LIKKGLKIANKKVYKMCHLGRKQPKYEEILGLFNFARWVPEFKFRIEQKEKAKKYDQEF